MAGKKNKSKKPKPRSEKQNNKKQEAPDGRHILLPLNVIKTAYIAAKGLITVAAEACGLTVRQYKNYLYSYYKEEMAEVIESVIETRADRLMRVCDKVLNGIEKKTDLSLEIMSIAPEQRTPEDFELLKYLQVREMQFLVFMMQIYAKHRGFSLVYNAADYSVDTTTGDKLAVEEQQIVSEGLKEVARYNPEIISQLKVIQGGKK